MDAPKQLAIEAAGGITALAGKLKVSYQAIQQWPRIPDKWLLEVERVTGVPREKLRPELYRIKRQKRAA